MKSAHHIKKQSHKLAPLKFIIGHIYSVLCCAMGPCTHTHSHRLSSRAHIYSSRKWQRIKNLIGSVEIPRVNRAAYRFLVVVVAAAAVCERVFRTFDQQILGFFKCFQVESNELFLSFYFSSGFFLLSYYNDPIGLSHCTTTFKLVRIFSLSFLSQQRSNHIKFKF